jgi:CIC family chloride channel protein
MLTRLSSHLLTARSAVLRLFRISDWQISLLWSVAAGLLGAGATECFRKLLHGVDTVVFGPHTGMVSIALALPWYVRIISPALGGLAAGALLVWARRMTVQKATSDYMEAIVVGDGRIPVGQALVRSASSLLSISSGGSIGREGSMVQLSALAASLLGRVLRMPLERLRLLVACGAAAGITSAYNAPIAGAFFVAEIVLGTIAMESVGPIMVASVVANIAMRSFPGYQPPYEMPAFANIAGVEVLLFALMGVLIGGAAALFLRGLAQGKRQFSRLPLPLPLRLALGGLIVGLISVAVPQVWGNGYSVVNGVLHNPGPWWILLVLLVAKVVATLGTSGSGAVGGVFTPALFVGCLVGSLFGHGVHALWPAATSASSAYAIVGMGAFLAAATQAPLMAVLMIFEMTLSYEVMLPLMAASVVAYFVARSIQSGSMYQITVQRRKALDERTRLRGLQMRELIEPAHTVVQPDADLAAMSRLFLQYPVKFLYVTNAVGHFLGVVPLKALSAALDAEKRMQADPENGGADLHADVHLANQPAAVARTAHEELIRKRATDLLSDEIRPLAADMELGQALQRFLEHRGERLPVIESAVNPVLLGVVGKSALLATYVRLSE